MVEQKNIAQGRRKRGGGLGGLHAPIKNNEKWRQ